MERSTRKMRLAPFIREKQECILEEFEEFARTHTSAGQTMDIRALRDHAAGLLEAIALDMDQPQSEADRERKSKGDVPDDGERADSAAMKHGTDRAACGFSLQEMCSEYRALRASVLKLWTDGHARLLDERDTHDVFRFNEALDAVMAESIPTFSAELDQAREMFLAILGHDLRTPLNAIVAASNVLATNGRLAGRDRTLAERIYNSGKRMDDLVSDLVDLTRSRMGRGIPISPTEIDLGEIGREVVDEVRTTHPTAVVQFEVRGEVRGEWDPSRMSQVVSNMIANAVQHGDHSTPIVVSVRGEADAVCVSTHNVGSVIEAEDQELIFDPFKRIGTDESERRRRRSMGLGLYIAREIALAHGGSIEVRSTAEEGTTFELHLPRRVPARQPVGRRHVTPPAGRHRSRWSGEARQGARP